LPEEKGRTRRARGGFEGGEHPDDPLGTRPTVRRSASSSRTRTSRPTCGRRSCRPPPTPTGCSRPICPALTDGSVGVAASSVARARHVVVEDAVARSAHRSAADGVSRRAHRVAHRDPIKSTASFLRLTLPLARGCSALRSTSTRSCRTCCVSWASTSAGRCGPVGASAITASSTCTTRNSSVTRSASCARCTTGPGDELTPSTEQAMLDWLKRHPQDRFGVQPYSLDGAGVTTADTGAGFRRIPFGVRHRAGR